jgi:hypothetical protein
MEKQKEIKINFKNFWENFNPEDNFFTNLLRKEYKVTISDNPDYIIYSVYSNSAPKMNLSKKGDFLKKYCPSIYYYLRKFYIDFKTSFIKKEAANSINTKAVKIFYGAEHVKPNMEECDWAFSSYFEEDLNHPRYMRLPCYLVNDHQLGKKAIPLENRKVDFKKNFKEKKKFCNFIYSQFVPSRDNFFKRLNKYKKVDAPGKCMNNMSPIGSHKDAKSSRMFKNWVEEKLDFIKDYKFTIAFENMSSKGWVTEKLTHPMLVNSIPIYFGHPAVSREFNTKSFINFYDFKNISEMINHIKKVDQDITLYKKYLEEPFYLKGVGTKYFSEERYLKRFREIFD